MLPAPFLFASLVTDVRGLIDRAGVVRCYHPGAASEAELSVRIQAILRE
jgi:hypothetical protein